MFRYGGNADTRGLLRRNLGYVTPLPFSMAFQSYRAHFIFGDRSMMRPFQGSAGAREQASGRRRGKHDLHNQLPCAAQGGQERHARVHRQKTVSGAGVREARLRQVSEAQYTPKPARSLARSCRLL